MVGETYGRSLGVSASVRQITLNQCVPEEQNIAASIVTPCYITNLTWHIYIQAFESYLTTYTRAGARNEHGILRL